MFRIIAICSLLLVVSFSNLQAQSESEKSEIIAFTLMYVDAYNYLDANTIRKMYTEDAVRLDIVHDRGETDNDIASYFDKSFIMKSADQIAASYEEEFKKVNNFLKEKFTIEIKQTNVSWSEAQSAYVASGTYEAKATNEIFDFELHKVGEFAHTMIVEDGEWKIEKSVWISTTRVENSLERRMQAFNQNFIEAYNNTDHEAIKKMYAKEAIHTDITDNENAGNENVALFFEQSFIKEKATLDLTITDISWPDPKSDAYLVIGTYMIKGKTYVYDIEINETGNFAHTMIYGENGEWIIAKSVWTSDD